VKPAAATPAGEVKPAAGADLQPPAALIGDAPKLDADGKPIVEQPKVGADGKPIVEPKPAAEVPIKYEFKIPDGVEADQKMLDSFTAIAAESKLPQEVAQKMVDLYANAVKEANDSPYRLWADTQKAWQETVRNDPELGGDNFDTMRATIANAIDRVAGKEAQAFRDALNFTGAGNNPEIIRALYRFSLPYAEGGQVTGQPARVEPPKSAAEVLYPDQGTPA
jgi:hypothetical protein